MSSVRNNFAARTVRVKAPGKINVSFRVGPLRPDGYHAVASLYLAVSLYEEVTATSTSASGVTVSIKGCSTAEAQRSGIPLDERNLAVRAALLMADVTERTTGVHLEITKRVPVSGGMGGGSADAAATLLACDALWDSGLAREELAHLAVELGADVPFALLGGAAVGLGVGELLTPALAPSPLHWVLVQADFGLSTPEVFGQLDRLRLASGAEPLDPGQVDPAVLQALRAGDAQALAPVLGNDLQPASLALAPQLAEVLDHGKQHGALASIVSGSGPTIALLAADEASASGLAQRLVAAGSSAQAVHGPVHGAKLVSDLVH
ncbi:4-(cytidine 5'-diphospho)-2-C-methyl-D-erythritol kinase [Paenarthrobacter sp. Z7-10]|uniref:4-(cytidine 5'-diphospho)-2-C-methyl-D-erythritol kinase n=1 Tax=Paenarthrobacter sp. Z7-10 TaxID=2787635 RepID=UPI0022A9A900|nr:4-(cytidine 5'-diphospho)-2-C-methyl-D-erythritol kinase [Paenarthrobacter sp. Z7-10]MCZ2403270.1 4-(cytidine 5'-diphospho)-2-C-methyl-D-erythritol kinase [Paenarthrobacter sp. Z7-10]